jgi:Ribbon-helix-helix protein, copG family
MITISLKLPEELLTRLEKESRARRTTKSSVIRECLEEHLPCEAPTADLPKLPPGESVYDKALPILKRAWARSRKLRRKLPRDLSTNPKYMKGFGE